MPELTSQELELALETLPNTILARLQKTEKAYITLKIAEAKLKQKEALEYLKVKATDSKATIATIKAKVDVALLEDRLNLIKLESEYRKASNEADVEDDRFTAIKKIVNLRIKEWNIYGKGE